MASSSKPKKIYDVFLSFRGADLRHNFVSHLYQALHRIGIHTFRDSEELKKGDDISMLMKAIEESCIAIIVFSENYASSTWCLQEVAKIMECKEQNDLSVRPVFYKVDPREVREGRESYGKALAKHESKFGKDLEKVNRWKKALFDAGSLSGWPLNDGDEAELIQSIVKEISNHLDRKPLHVAKHPVGIDYRVVKLKSMLNLESDDGVLMIGLWGQGGIGKTSIAKAFYNAMFRQFEGSCFLAKVRETSKDSRGLVTLQEKLLNDILFLQQRLEVSSVDEGINIIQHRFGCKKVLLILDDVDDLYQLNALAGESKWFGNGSRVIFTTRDKHLLTCHGINQDYVYEVQALDDDEAHELLSKHAFSTHQKLKIRTDLMKSVVNHAKGLPLALEVLGSFLCGRREHEWQSTLNRLSKIPNKTINDVLKLSYDGLEEDWKEIFLHIACFFKGSHSEYVKEVLDGCDLEATIGFEILIEKSLIRIEFGILEMHDLIQSMGMDIVNQECRDDPGKRSRLWLYDDVRDVLQHNYGGCTIKAIVLNSYEQKELCIHPNAFTKMRRLRLLIGRGVHNSFQGPIWLPNELRWIEWAGYGLWNPHFFPGPKKLVRLDISNCSIPGIIKLCQGFQRLKSINLSSCNSLVSLPDLSCTPNLEELDVWNCQNLVEAHESIACHDKLHALCIWFCSKFSAFPKVLKSTNLQKLRIGYCPKFERFPDIPHALEDLKFLELSDTDIKELPASIGNLCSLETMLLTRCQRVSLPTSIYKVQNVRELGISSCTNLIGLPKYDELASPHRKIGLPNLKTLSLWGCNLSDLGFLEDLSYFPLLSELDLGCNNITSLPTSISKHGALSQLKVNSCHQLQEIPERPPYSKWLRAEGCESLQTSGHLTSVDQWVRRVLNLVDPASINEDAYLFFLLPGREMPEWFQPVEESSLSFMSSKDLYDKFLGLIFCVVVEGDYESSTHIEAHFNGERRCNSLRFLYTVYSDRILLRCCSPSDLWHVVDFGQIDGSHARFSITLSGKGVKKWGVRIICKPLGDDSKIEIRDNQLMDLRFLYEVVHDSTDTEVKSSPCTMTV